MKTLLLFLSVALAAPSVTAWAAPQTPRATVETIVEKARELDKKETRAANQSTIESLVDFQKLATDALGPHAAKATAAQRTEIKELLRKIITKTVYPEAPKFFRDVTIQFKEQEDSEGQAHISSIVTKGQKRSTVEYWLAPGADGYKVVDLAIEGERWVENVGDQFDEVIRKEGVSGLINRMKKRLKDIEAGPRKA